MSATDVEPAEDPADDDLDEQPAGDPGETECGPVGDDDGPPA